MLRTTNNYIPGITPEAYQVILLADLYSKINNVSLINSIKYVINEIENDPSNLLHPSRLNGILSDSAYVYACELNKKYGTIDIEQLYKEIGISSIDTYGLFLNSSFPKPIKIEDNILVRRPNLANKITNMLHNKGNPIIHITGNDNTYLEDLVQEVINNFHQEKKIAEEYTEFAVIDCKTIFYREDTEYLDRLIEYTKVLEEKNIYLIFRNIDYFIDKDEKIFNRYATKFIKHLLNTYTHLIICGNEESLKIIKEYTLLKEIVNYDSSDISSENVLDIYDSIINNVFILEHDKDIEFIIDGDTYTYGQTIDLCKALKKVNYPLQLLSQQINRSINSNSKDVKINIEVGISSNLSKLIYNLENQLNLNIIGQSESISNVVKVIKKSLMFKDDKVIGRFMFTGPTGVGKTETAKQLCNIMFNNEKNFLRIDMSEYVEEHRISSLIGSPPGYVGSQVPTFLETFLKDTIDEGGVILFDEIEKAHSSIIKLLLNVLEEGSITMGTGTRYMLNKYIICCTSNVHTYKKTIGYNGNDQQKDMNKFHKTFSPELVSRFDHICQYNDLDVDMLKKIADIKMREKADYSYKNNNIYIEWDKKVIDYIVKNSQRKDGRAITQFVKNEVMVVVIDYIVENPKCKNMSITIDKKNNIKIKEL